VQVGGHHVAELGEPIDALGVLLGEQTDRTAVVDHDHRAVRPLVDQRQGVADRGIGRQRDRGLEDRVAPLHVLDDAADHVDGDVLGEDGNPAAAGDGLGHAAPSDRRHVGNHQGDRRADPVGRGEVDVHP